MSRSSRRVRKMFDWSRIKPSTAVVETVASVAETDPTDLDILARSVDPDALDRLVQGSNEQNPGVGVLFQFMDYEVAVHGDGEVVVSPVEGRRD